MSSSVLACVPTWPRPSPLSAFASTSYLASSLSLLGFPPYLLSPFAARPRRSPDLDLAGRRVHPARRNRSLLIRLVRGLSVEMADGSVLSLVSSAERVLERMGRAVRNRSARASDLQWLACASGR